MIVSNETIREVTGYITNAGQRRWLTDHGWTFGINRLGRPIVLQAEVERNLLGKLKQRERSLKSLAA